MARHIAALITWTALAAYLIVTSLPAGGLVQCSSEPGHLAIEFAHRACPTRPDTADQNPGSRQTLASRCTDTPVIFTVAQHRRPERVPYLNLQHATPVAILPQLPTSTDLCAPGHTPAAHFPRGHQPVQFLRTIVLLI